MISYLLETATTHTTEDATQHCEVLTTNEPNYSSWKSPES